MLVLARRDEAEARVLREAAEARDRGDEGLA